MTRQDVEKARQLCSGSKEACLGKVGAVGVRRICFALKTLPAHRLAGVHKHGALYSSRRAPRCGRPAGRRVSARRGREGENDGLFEHPVFTGHEYRISRVCYGCSCW